MYTEKVMDHFAHPRNMGEIEGANGVGMVGNAKCGDIMQMFLKVNDDGIIEDVGFKTFGCGAAVATSSMATELIKGKSIDEAHSSSPIPQSWKRLKDYPLKSSIAPSLPNRPSKLQSTIIMTVLKARPIASATA